MNIRIEMTGVGAVTQKLAQLIPAPMAPLGEALRAEGNQIIRVANTLVPVDTGLLRSTGHVEAPIQAGPVVSVSLGYGQGIAPYAAIIEFDVTLNHPHGGQAHFFQQPLFATTQGFTQRIANALRGSLA
jgi:hypothetical protein